MRISGRRQEMLKIYREIRSIPEPTLTEKLMYIPNSKLTIDQRFIKTKIIEIKRKQKQINTLERLIQQNNIKIESTLISENEKLRLNRVNDYNRHRILTITNEIIDENLQIDEEYRINTRRYIGVLSGVRSLTHYETYYVKINTDEYYIHVNTYRELQERLSNLNESYGNTDTLIFLGSHAYSPYTKKRGRGSSIR